MARYTGPKTKISRRFGVALFGPSKALERKNYGPGMHGPKGSRRKQSDYAVALAERCAVGRLVLFHHDPWRTDDAVAAIVRRFRDGPVAVVAAVEGDTITL